MGRQGEKTYELLDDILKPMQRCRYQMTESNALREMWVKMSDVVKNYATK